MGEDLDGIVAALQRAAGQLRTTDLSPQQAATLIEDCARLAAEGAAALDREVRAGEAATAPGQLAFE